MVVGDFPIEVETLVVGSGPGGYVAAIRAAQLGQKVTIVERENLRWRMLERWVYPIKSTNFCWSSLCTSEKFRAMGITAADVKLDFSKAQEFKDGVVTRLTGGVRGLMKGNKIDVVQGEAYFVDENTVRIINGESAQTYKFKNAIVATGSRPVEIPTFKFSERVLSSTGALSLKEVA